MLNCLYCHNLINKKDYKYGLHSSCFSKWFKCTPLSRFIGLSPQKTVSNQELKVANSSFFHGKFLKYTAELESKKFILKVMEKNYPNLPRTEYVCNQIGRLLKIPVPDFYLIKLSENTQAGSEEIDTFVTSNFYFDSGWKNMTHIWHYLPPGELNVEMMRKKIFELTHNPADVYTFDQVLLFDALIGNNDRHGRNLAILNKGARNKLAPIYDNTSHVGVEIFLESDLNPFGTIHTKKSKEPSMKDYVVELKRLKAENSLTLFSKRCKMIEIKKVIASSVLDPRVKNALINLITKRYEEFKNTI